MNEENIIGKDLQSILDQAESWDDLMLNKDRDYSSNIETTQTKDTVNLTVNCAKDHLLDSKIDG